MNALTSEAQAVQQAHNHGFRNAVDDIVYCRKGRFGVVSQENKSACQQEWVFED